MKAFHIARYPPLPLTSSIFIIDLLLTLSFNPSPSYYPSALEPNIFAMLAVQSLLPAVGLLLLLSRGRVRAEEVTCYAPDGVTIADNETYVPCNKLGITQTGIHSSCCRLDGDQDARDICSTSGLCTNQITNLLTRGYCTDKTWASAACVNVCTDPDVRLFSPLPIVHE